MMEGYAREAERMVLEGATPRQVDGALEAWGMAMGILAVFDMAGIDVGVNVHQAQTPTAIRRIRPIIRRTSRCTRPDASARRTARATTDTCPATARAMTIPRPSRSSGRRRSRLGIAQRDHSDEEIVERCLYPLINEGIRILEEGVALRAERHRRGLVRGLWLSALSRRTAVLCRHHRPEDRPRRHSQVPASCSGPCTGSRRRCSRAW